MGKLQGGNEMEENPEKIIASVLDSYISIDLDPKYLAKLIVSRLFSKGWGIGRVKNQ